MFGTTTTNELEQQLTDIGQNLDQVKREVDTILEELKLKEVNDSVQAIQTMWDDLNKNLVQNGSKSDFAYWANGVLEPSDMLDSLESLTDTIHDQNIRSLDSIWNICTNAGTSEGRRVRIATRGFLYRYSESLHYLATSVLLYSNALQAKGTLTSDEIDSKLGTYAEYQSALILHSIAELHRRIPLTARILGLAPPGVQVGMKIVSRMPSQYFYDPQSSGEVLSSLRPDKSHMGDGLDGRGLPLIVGLRPAADIEQTSRVVAADNAYGPDLFSISSFYNSAPTENVFLPWSQRGELVRGGDSDVDYGYNFRFTIVNGSTASEFHISNGSDTPLKPTSKGDFLNPWELVFGTPDQSDSAWLWTISDAACHGVGYAWGNLWQFRNIPESELKSFAPEGSDLDDPLIWSTATMQWAQGQTGLNGDPQARYYVCGIPTWEVGSGVRGAMVLPGGLTMPSVTVSRNDLEKAYEKEGGSALDWNDYTSVARAVHLYAMTCSIPILEILDKSGGAKVATGLLKSIPSDSGAEVLLVSALFGEVLGINDGILAKTTLHGETVDFSDNPRDLARAVMRYTQARFFACAIPLWKQEATRHVFAFHALNFPSPSN
ncbi:MAG: hypothetical protein KDA88_16635 [Planctomycetaceae bacterium]|nr:hypothetical protein [Planctomycetaceae bacterium]MCB9949453.1 hypothetical protein [Planctomycetaceae bacterium]